MGSLSLYKRTGSQQNNGDNQPTSVYSYPDLYIILRTAWVLHLFDSGQFFSIEPTSVYSYPDLYILLRTAWVLHLFDRGQFVY